MAKISVRILKDQKLSVALIRGKITIENLEAMRSNSTRPTADLLMVYRDLDGQGVTAEQLREFAMSVFSEGVVGRTAFVVSTDLEFGLTRIFDALTDTNDNQVQRRVFRSLIEAANWFGIELSELTAVVSELEREGDE